MTVYTLQNGKSYKSERLYNPETKIYTSTYYDTIGRIEEQTTHQQTATGGIRIEASFIKKILFFRFILTLFEFKHPISLAI